MVVWKLLFKTKPLVPIFPFTKTSHLFQDNHEEATIGAFMMFELMSILAKSTDIDDDIDELLQDFESKCNRPILHTVVFY